MLINPPPPLAWARSAREHLARGGWSALHHGAYRADARALGIAALLHLPAALPLPPAAASAFAGGYLGTVYRLMIGGSSAAAGAAAGLVPYITFGPAVKAGMRARSTSRIPAGALAAWVRGRLSPDLTARLVDAWAAYVAIPAKDRLPLPPGFPVALLRRAVAATSPFG